MRREIGALIALAALLTALEFWLWPAPAHVPPGVTAPFAFVGCVAIVVVAKALGNRWLQEPEDRDE